CGNSQNGTTATGCGEYVATAAATPRLAPVSHFTMSAARTKCAMATSGRVWPDISQVLFHYPVASPVATRCLKPVNSSGTRWAEDHRFHRDGEIQRLENRPDNQDPARQFR